ncbi:MAG: hypothetical protein OXI77_06255 [Chloroflexota bacterium]|nr:hypothetical protein [Chloroflexota bacterium]MDE2909811.1 hypothetical protein [Chloroflexota bacterium]
MLRKIGFLVALLLLLLPLAATFADSVEDAFLCGNLAEADCAIKNNNSAVMDEVQAFAFVLLMRMDIEAADPSENTSVTMEGGGRVALDPALMEASKALETAAGMDPAAMMSLANELFGGLAAEMSLIVTMAGADETSELPLNLLLKDGIVALDMAAFADESDESAAGWLGIELADIVDSAGQETDMTAEMGGMDHGALAEARSIVRLPDSEVNGQPVAVFQTALEYEALLESMGMVADLSGALGADAAALEVVGDASLHVLEYISLVDSYTQRLELEISTMEEATGETAPFSFSMTMRLDMSEFNEPVNVALPEDVFIMPLAMMRQMNQ